MSTKSEKEHYNRIEKRAKRIQTLYYKAVRETSNITQGIVPPFSFKEFPVVEKKVDKIVENLRENMEHEIRLGVEEEWGYAVKNNQKDVTRLAKKTTIPKEKLEVYQSRNLEALSAFQDRKAGGLNLSERVWNLSKNLKGELEQAIDLGLADGRSASELSRDIRNFLNRPNDLYRRVRSETGRLIQSQSSIKRIKAEGISYGPGVYKSSYKNAMRVARTEINSAYRMSDYHKRQQLDFVVGIEIKRSNHVYDCDVCESLKGQYPKDFIFTNWHPHCRCFTTSILSTEDEFITQQRALLEGKDPEEIESENTIKDVPQGFKDYLEENKDRIERAQGRGTEPWWMKDNQKFVDQAMNPEIAQEKQDTQTRVEALKEKLRLHQEAKIAEKEAKAKAKAEDDRLKIEKRTKSLEKQRIEQEKKEAEKAKKLEAQEPTTEKKPIKDPVISKGRQSEYQEQYNALVKELKENDQMEGKVSGWTAKEEHARRRTELRNEIDEIRKYLPDRGKIAEDRDASMENRTFKRLTLEDYTKMLRAREKLNVEDENHIYDKDHGYIASKFSYAVNTFHRGLEKGKYYSRMDIDKKLDWVNYTTQVLDSAISQSPTKEDLTVVRYTGHNWVSRLLGESGELSALKDNVLKELVGKDLTDKGFVSASLTEEVSIFRSMPVMIEIKVPRGTHGYISQYHTESEIVFGRNQKQVCTGVRREGTKIIIETVMR